MAFTKFELLMSPSFEKIRILSILFLTTQRDPRKFPASTAVPVLAFPSSYLKVPIVASSPRGSGRRCNVIFTCFCKCYLFLFPILRECTLVKCHCGTFIELASSTIGQRVKRVLDHRAKLGQCAKFSQRAKTGGRQRT